MGRSAVEEREKGVLGENGEYPGEGFPEVFFEICISFDGRN